MDNTAAVRTDNRNRSGVKDRTKKIVVTGMLGALSAVLMVFEFPVPLSPTFVKMDFSELPVMIGGFLMGPLYGSAVALIKVLLHFVLHGTTTMGVGELANLIGSLAYVVPASLFYFAGKTKKRGGQALVLGTVTTSIVMTLANAFVVFPLYIRLFGMTQEALIQMGTVTNPLVTNMLTMAVFSILPFNLFKYGVVSLITWFVYKKVSRALKM